MVGSRGRGEPRRGSGAGCENCARHHWPVLTCGAKRVRARKLPHAREQLSKAANEEGHADDDVRCGDAPGLDVVHGEDEGRRREAEETAVDTSEVHEHRAIAQGLENLQRTGVAQLAIVEVTGGARVTVGGRGVGSRDLGLGLLEMRHGDEEQQLLYSRDEGWKEGR